MIDFKLYFEYLNDADMQRAQAADAAWRKKQEAKQAKWYGKFVRRVIERALEVKAVFVW